MAIGRKCQIVFTEKSRRPNLAVNVADSDMRREGSLSQAALYVADLLGDRDVIGVLYNGRWID